MLDFMFYCGLVVLAALPFTLKLAGRYYSRQLSDNFISMLLIFAVSGVCGLMIIAQLRRMMKTVIEGACFVPDNVRSLQVMARLSLVIAVYCAYSCYSNHCACIFYCGFIQPGTGKCVCGGDPVQGRDGSDDIGGAA